MNRTISREVIEDALDNANVDYAAIDDDTYSGRGMYGDTCLSVVFAGKRIQRDLCGFMVELGSIAAANDDVDAQMHVSVRRLAADVCTDDLGLDMIVYFPGWKLTD